MKKLLGIVVLGLLFSSKAYAGLIIFDRCWLTNEYKSFKEYIKEGSIDNRLYEINIEKGTAVRTVIWSDAFIRKAKEMQNNNVDIDAKKIDQNLFRIKASTSTYVTTHPLILKDKISSQEYVFHLKTGKAEQTYRGSFTSTGVYKCDKVSSK